MTKYNTFKKALIGTLIAGSLGLGACKKNSVDIKNVDINKKVQSLESQIDTQEAELQKLKDSLTNQDAGVVNNIYCGSNGGQGKCHKNQGNNSYNRNSGCGYDNPCGLPDQYKGAEILCDDPSSHCNNMSDSNHELLIIYENGYLFNNSKNVSYVDTNSVRINYKDGSGPHQGEIANDLVFLVQNLDNCSSTELAPGNRAPDYKNMFVYEFGKINGNFVQIASTPLSDWGNSDNRNHNPRPSPNPPTGGPGNGGPGSQTPPPGSGGPGNGGNTGNDNPTGGPGSGGPGNGGNTGNDNPELTIYPIETMTSCNLDLNVRLRSGEDVENSFVLGIPVNAQGQINYAIEGNGTTITKAPESLFLGLCDDGTDPTGNIQVLCTSNRFLKHMNNLEAKYDADLVDNCSTTHPEFKDYKFFRYTLEELADSVGENHFFTATFTGIDNNGKKIYVEGYEPTQ